METTREGVFPLPAAPSEITVSSVVLGTLLVVLFAAANAYLGLYAGMTVSATIPGAVLSIAILRGLFRRGTILEHNIVQTFASTGESLAGAATFTIPALLIAGAWDDIPFWPTTLICLCGGLLGVIFMVPLRRRHVTNDPALTYPEGVACAEVLKAGESAGHASIFISMGLGATFKFLTSGVAFIRSSVEYAWSGGGIPFFIGSDISPALLGVGFIVGLNLSAVILFGGVLTWCIAIPFHNGGMQLPADLVAWFWSTWKLEARYLGVGAMMAAGFWALLQVFRDFWRDFWIARRAANAKGNASDEKDVPSSRLIVMLAAITCLIFIVYQHLVGSSSISLVSTVSVVALSFFLVILSSSMAGLVGTSNAPISGMVICAILTVSGLLLILGMTGTKGIIATLAVASVVCCAAATGGDLSQNLKTGSLVGASPRKQELVKVIAVVLSALVMAPIILILHHAYGIGTGQPGSLKAPQATLIASIAKGLLGEEAMPWHFIAVGAAVGLLAIVVDGVLKARHSKLRVPPMALAVGMYLPVTLSVPMFVGGIIASLVKKKNGVAGLLFASGLIAGEAIVGVLIGAVIYFARAPLPVPAWSSNETSLVAFAVLAGSLLFAANRGRAGDQQTGIDHR